GNRPIFVSGASMGGMTALFVAANRPVAGVIVLNPPPLRQIVLQQHAWWNAGWLSLLVAMEIPPELDAVANARRCTAPLFAIVSDDDSVVPARLQELIYSAYNGEKRVLHMPDASHNTHVSADIERQRQRWLDVQWKRAVREN
ncbi:MAG: alpha/beta hydrolase, partial [Tepidisphaeraceae bacterium]